MEAAAAHWWIWPLALFAVSFAIGIVAVLGGIGGGVLFVPIVGSFFPFHLDFVRGAGLVFALAGTLAAGPSLLRNRHGEPAAGDAARARRLGGLVRRRAWSDLRCRPTRCRPRSASTVIAIAVLIAARRTPTARAPSSPTPLGAALRLRGDLRRPGERSRASTGARTAPLAGFGAFGAIGFLGGLFGLGAGFANVPALNLLMAAPLKVAVGSSGLIISIIDSSAAWVYLHRGAVLPILAVPAILGVMLGSRIGARLLR